ncbi:YdeI/OmpD-associated family protein [Nocardioides donggukensis]|uniref:OmdA domain containing protein n=1 Tax=Nocardioides donggukensis TaxID=2774019 RepID=A0A927Q1T0_9ACTN|nr:hypothetical protein [Nocardioides donggukensis]MBD8869729.1 hypothetical protein [Nocardioides donggukensis]
MESFETSPEDGWEIRPFVTPAAFEEWLDLHHDTAPGVWVRIAKKGRGIPSLTLEEAIEVLLCFGWIDSKGRRLDDDWFLLRCQPRRPRSNWSERNQRIVARLVEAGRMRPAGLARVEQARSEGRWGSGDPEPGPRS